jgi:hypothetical protein
MLELKKHTTLITMPGSQSSRMKYEESKRTTLIAMK